MVRSRGFTFAEVLVASIVLMIGVLGMFGIWNTSMIQIQHAHEVNMAGEIARADIETAKIMGFTNLPIGTYTGQVIYPPDTTASSYGTSTGTVTYYDTSGVKQSITSSNSSTRYSLQRIVKDYRVNQAASGTGYTLTAASVRVIKVEVRQFPGNTALLTMGHILVQGGV